MNIVEDTISFTKRMVFSASVFYCRTSYVHDVIEAILSTAILISFEDKYCQKRTYLQSLSPDGQTFVFVLTLVWTQEQTEKFCSIFTLPDKSHKTQILAATTTSTLIIWILVSCQQNWEKKVSFNAILSLYKIHY